MQCLYSKSHGITRTDGSGLAGYTAHGVNYGNNTNGVDELVIKNLTRWDPSQYNNIYAVKTISGGIFGDGGSGGFAYYPGAGGTYDGVIITANAVVAGEPVFPHEVGHGFNLPHPFDDASGNNCPVNTFCDSYGDRVCDTDPITQPNGECRTGNNPCTNTPYSINTEHKQDCSAFFAPGNLKFYHYTA